MSQLQRRKKQKLTKETLKSTIENQEKWQVPYSMISNLESSVQSLISSNNSLQSTLHLLDSATKDFTRHCEFAKHDRLYEVVTESDIRSAQLEISKDVLPELEQLLSEADQLLGLLQVQEKESKQKVEEQQQILSHLRTAVKFATSQSKILSNTKVNKNKESASSAVLNQLKDKQKRLKLLIDVEDRKIKEETIELKGLQKEILQLEKEMEQVIPSDNGSELVVDKDKHKLELIKQLADLKQQTIKKKESYEEKQQIEASRASDSSSIQIKETQLNTLESIQQYTNYLALTQTVLEAINQEGFITSEATLQKCEIQCKRYLQAIQNEKKQTPKSNTNLNIIQQLKTICKATMPNHMIGKTTGRILELILTQDELRIPVQEVLKEFPAAKEKRHNLTKAMLILFEANIIDINGTDLIIK